MNLRVIFSLFLLILSLSVFSQTKNKSASATNKEVTNPASQEDYVTVLWLDKNRNLQLNDEFIKTITNQQRAALGYIATSIGNECSWDGDEKPDKSNLKCKFLWALNLGYQCSETHLSFLRKWFKEDAAVLQNLQYCSKTESSEKNQDFFIVLKMATLNNTIRIIYTAAGFDEKTPQKWSWTEESTYSFTKNEIKQIHRRNINGGFN
ncbi:hypothetical protein [Flavobacterium sp. ABG]|uniref:hypothetical protein n=1 Tax=Flavobacterium sp. ABG TaxID=1423322 RepID=UPI00064A9A3F|nr:hypothetical protein [Flavobacterium sp. ABG]KLT70237.1 hypothetical protein AB674_08490 [Flavobacterium sp. ABG]